ncbi:hypothetical protein OIO90_000744 [Microbotryomycetes sp. JL221]|nr:hypothetical protein OIO90_000744 [Microbotryomycetes sp. JL221]
MASLPPPSPAAMAVQPRLSPIIHSFTTPDLHAILHRSHFNSMSHMLSAFEASVEKVQVRSTTYEPRQLPRFPVKFVERQLPAWFEQKVSGVTNGRTRPRSSTMTSSTSQGSSHSNATQLEGNLTPVNAARVVSHSPQQLLPPGQLPQTPQTPFTWPTQAERDELFLDSLSSLVGSSVDGWMSQTGRQELEVRGARPKPRLPDTGQELEPVPEFDEGWQGRSIENLTPWYAAFRDQVLARREMVEWDTFAWPVGCLLALSTSHPDPMNALASLWDLTSKENLFSSASFPPRSGAEEDGRLEWAQPDILRYIVLVHDFGAGGGRDGWEDAQTLHDTIRKTYGLHTALLSIFSASDTAAKPQPRAHGIQSLWTGSHAVSPPRPPPVMDLGITDDGATVPTGLEKQAVGEVKDYGFELSDDDIRALRVFVREMVVQSLIPWMERATVVGNEQFAASKRSIGGRLFSAGRKYFGSATSSRSGSPVSASGAPLGFNSARGFYPYASQESQLRRVADLAFMLTDYKFAATVYESVSKDMRNDKAWRYFSSASRMCGLSQMLALTQDTAINFNPDQWLELASQTPTAASVNVDLDGIQAMMLYYEVYRAHNDWRFAPNGLVRTAGESDELCSALLLEQAAIADLHLPRSSKRKFAFHMSMAAARFEKCGFKSLSRRCLSQASTVFRAETFDSDPVRHPQHLPLWTGIRGHLHHGLGRQAYKVGLSVDAAEQFLQLLVGQESFDGEDALDETDWLEDFALAWEYLGSNADEIAAQRQLTIPIRLFDAESTKLRLGREDANLSTEADTEAWIRLSDQMLSQWPGSDRPTSLSMSGASNEVVLGESFYVELAVRNPLGSVLKIADVQLLTDAAPGALEIATIDDVNIEPRATQTIFVPVRATSEQPFQITAVSYRFNGMLRCEETLERPGKPRYTQGKPEPVRLKQTLSCKVQPPAPALTVSFDETPKILRAGEGRHANIVLTNVGQGKASSVHILCDTPSMLLFTGDDAKISVKSSSSNAILSNSLVPQTPLKPASTSEGLDGGEAAAIPVILRGDSVGYHRIRMLVAFREPSGKYLTARAETSLEVMHSLETRPLIRTSVSPSRPFGISLHITNVDVPEDVVITAVSAVSPSWRLCPLEGVPASEMILPLQQSAVLHFAVEAIEGAADESRALTDFVVRQIGYLLDGKDVPKESPPNTRLFASNVAAAESQSLNFDSSSAEVVQSVMSTHRALRLASLSAQYPIIPMTLLRHLFPLFSPRTLDLLVFWTVPSTGARGHHHLTGIPLGAGSNDLKDVLAAGETKAGGLYAESQRERTLLLSSLARSEFGRSDNPVKVWIEVNDAIEHDFDEGPCIVPVAFKIRNLSTTKAFSYEFFLTDVSIKLPLDVAFSGPITHRGIVAPLAIETVSTQLWISRQGSYNVGGWKLIAKSDPDLMWTELGRRFDVRVGLVRQIHQPQSSRNMLIPVDA